MAAPASETVTLLLAGDVMTGRGIDQILSYPSAPELQEPYLIDARQYVELAQRAHGPVPAPVPPHYPWGEALELIERYAPQRFLVNLETSVTTQGGFWPDKEIHYRMHPLNVGCLTAAGIDLCALANNHMLDFGRAGLVETLAVLEEAGIATAGAGRDDRDATEPAQLDLAGGASLWVAALGSETSGIPSDWAAGPERPGIDLLADLTDQSADAIAARIQARRRPGDLAVASIHWGSNWGHDISHGQQSFAHRLIDRGIDLVHGHSSHHLRAIELYRGKLILYGCGDLITDYEGIRGHEAWRGDLGALHFATLSRADGSLVGLRLVPVQMQRMRLVRASGDDAHWLREVLQRVSEPFGAGFVEDEEGLLWARGASAGVKGGGDEVARRVE